MEDLAHPPDQTRRNGVARRSLPAKSRIALLPDDEPKRKPIPLCVGDREARADCQCGELIDRIAAGAPVRKLLFVEALGHTRVPFAGYRPDHPAGIELATTDTHRAAEAATDLERRLGAALSKDA
jgi:hypothetical protein